MHARRGGLARRRTPVDWRTKMLCIQVTIRSSLKILAPTIKVRWICEQAHQQLKEELGLDHFEVRSWTGLHRHVRLDDHDRLRLSPSPPPQSCGTEKESAVHRHNRACQRLDKPFLTSSCGRHPADVRTVRSCWHTPGNLNCQNSAKSQTQNSSLAIRRVIRLIDERNIPASVGVMEASKSFVSRRHRLSQAKIRSMIHRLRRSRKPLA